MDEEQFKKDFLKEAEFRHEKFEKPLELYPALIKNNDFWKEIWDCLRHKPMTTTQLYHLAERKALERLSKDLEFRLVIEDFIGKNYIEEQVFKTSVKLLSVNEKKMEVEV